MTVHEVHNYRVHKAAKLFFSLLVLSDSMNSASAVAAFWEPLDN